MVFWNCLIIRKIQHENCYAIIFYTLIKPESFQWSKFRCQGCIPNVKCGEIPLKDASPSQGEEKTLSNQHGCTWVFWLNLDLPMTPGNCAAMTWLLCTTSKFRVIIKNLAYRKKPVFLWETKQEKVIKFKRQRGRRQKRDAMHGEVLRCVNSPLHSIVLGELWFMDCRSELREGHGRCGWESAVHKQKLQLKF
jgi:hypothetical protein